MQTRDAVMSLQIVSCWYGLYLASSSNRMHEQYAFAPV